MNELNWGDIADETVRHLQALVRLNTVNPPGNERIAADYIANVLNDNHITPVVINTAPNRANVVARLKGDGTLAPLLLYSHTDVVPVESEKWSVDPFGGIVKDGYVWGRGTIDMKGIGAMQLAVFLTLARQRAAGASPLKRDIIIAATADEENTTNQGIGVLVRDHPDLIRAEYAFSEFGGFSLQIGKNTFYPIQTAEKGTVWMRIRAKGKPGHASVPSEDNAVIHLGRALARIGRSHLPLHLTDTSRAFITHFAKGVSGAVGQAMLAWLRTNGRFEPPGFIFKTPNVRREFHAMLHNTCTPTGLSAGAKTNVIPSSAEVVLDCRTLPGISTDQLLAELRAVVGSSERFEFIVDSDSPPLEFSSDTPMFKHLCNTIKQYDPLAIPVPFMLTGATDAKHVKKLGTICYGFSPMKFKAGERFFEMAHAHDERISIDALAWGVRVLYDAVNLS
jgi:acetylornithine deacetylase/succinyl-diaminopimelate desuccinylase-like protein